MNVNEIKAHLTDCIIPFWKSLRDDEHGGYYGRVDFHLAQNRQADKGAILNSRILWFFSNAYLTLRDESCLKHAKHAYEFLKKAFLDKKRGGLYWSADYKGNPAETARYTYNQAFAVYALASYYDASRDTEALHTAYGLVRIIETYYKDDDGYLEAFDSKYKLLENEKLSGNGITAGRTMNTLLHIYEAYTELFRVDQKPGIAEKLQWILNVLESKIYNPEKKRLESYFDFEYNSLTDLTSYGHDIEASWLIDRGTDLLDIPRLEFTKTLAKQIHDIALDKDGSVFYENEAGKINKTKVWWVQAEAALGFLNAGYTEAAERAWEFIKTHVIDKRENSEWFNELDENNMPFETDMANEWKCPYHGGRFCFEIINNFDDCDISFDFSDDGMEF
jgi:mannobiose 2-epimerase